MKLVANVWPVVDSGTGIVLRFLMRAYALDAPDPVISATLRALAPTDFRMAKVFLIPGQFTVISEHGKLVGAISIGDFQRYQETVLRPALRELEGSFTKLQGVGVSEWTGEPHGLGFIPRFSDEPYLVVTTLLEYPDGRLEPYGV